ncbi:ANKRD28 [Symbiodinium pilosum]|uniref:ANKRD28 protein n=1 Tax=Symbiodinium pilosum TaxID=2952 RepID=A0A812WTF9_SYMPI|nr:ANKRD28 [Symbiodinium pilosum]
MGHTGIVGLLLAAGADKDESDVLEVTPLWAGAEQGALPVVAALLEARADKDKPRADGISPIQIASSKGHDEVVRLLTEAGAAIGEAAGTSQTPGVEEPQPKRPRQ